MLNLLRSKTVKYAVFVSLLLVVLVLIFGIVNLSKDVLNYPKNFPNRTTDQIDSLVHKGDLMIKVETALGRPNTADKNFWRYANARHSYRTESSYVPESITVGFNDLGEVDMIMKGPVPLGRK